MRPNGGRQTKLSIRIPWLIEAAAEGWPALVALVALTIVIIATKGLGWM
jgi:hypothetical protein